jgi:hypothetical protein
MTRRTATPRGRHSAKRVADGRPGPAAVAASEGWESPTLGGLLIADGDPDVVYACVRTSKRVSDSARPHPVSASRMPTRGSGRRCSRAGFELASPRGSVSVC